MPPKFVHLHFHSEYSLFDGLANIEQIALTCVQQSMPAIALTDQMNLFGLVKFYRACLNAGIKPIVGAGVYITNEHELTQPHQAILLCQNLLGYRHLSELISTAYLHGQLHGKAILQRDWIAAKAAGLIMLSGGQHGDIGRALLRGHESAASQLLQQWQAIFPQRYYLELQRLGQPNETPYINLVLPLAERQQVPVVATNAVRFLQADDFAAHEARVAIHASTLLTNSKRPKTYMPQQYLRTPEEMEKLFADIPSAVQNSVEIAKRCNLKLSLGEIFLPNFPLPAGVLIEQYLGQAAAQGLQIRLIKINPADPLPYQQRLQKELNLIVKMGFADYFLIVADFIQWAKDQGIPVGPGRGSGAGSLVAYALKITDIDPLAYDLLFERFLNPERVSMPDLDIDFCMIGRDRVIDYVAEKYGRDAVSQIITFGTMAAKAVIRDVGRVLGHPYGFVDKLAKLIPFELGITLTKALAQEELLRHRYEQEDDVKTLIDLAKKLEGVTRNISKHAGGVVIAPSKLTDFVPIYCEADKSNLVSQFDKDDVEAIGLVKLDFLGLRTLTIIAWAVQNINARLTAEHQPLIDITAIPLDDQATFTLLKACYTTAIFQLESRGMKELIKRLQPDCFTDIVSLVALFRPGPLQSGMVDDFINRKHKKSIIEYQHPQLEPILKSTYGVILYQEQVMQIAQSLGGYTLGSADLLRYAMGKKKSEEMAKQRLVFINGAVERGIDNKIASQIFDLMEKFAGYGFNKSHSVAYALLAYQTAWLKAHYLAEFMAAALSADLQNTDKIVVLFNDCKLLNVVVLSPNINTGHYKFSVSPSRDIRYGLGAIKGVGEGAIQALLEERTQSGVFTDLFSLCQRVDSQKMHRRSLEALIKAGALDDLAPDRATLLASLEKAMQTAQQASQNKSLGQADLFGHITGIAAAGEDYITTPEWTEKERLIQEKSVLGLFLSGHLFNRYHLEFTKQNLTQLRYFNPNTSQKTTLAGMITQVRTVSTRQGERMAFLTLDDGTACVDLAIYAELYQQQRELIAVDNMVIVGGEVARDNYNSSYRLNVNQVWSIEQWRSRHAKAIVLQLSQTQLAAGILDTLETTLNFYKPGTCPVLLDYNRDDGSYVRFKLSNAWCVRPCDDLLDITAKQLGVHNVRVLYG